MKQQHINYQKEAEILKALAHPTRLKIVDAVKDGKVCVSHLVELTGMSQSCVSQHLSILRNMGVVEPSRNGNLICYALNHELTENILCCIHDQYTNELKEA